MTREEYLARAAAIDAGPAGDRARELAILEYEWHLERDPGDELCRRTDILPHVPAIVAELRRLRSLPHVIYARGEEREERERLALFSWLCAECAPPMDIVPSIGGAPAVCAVCERPGSLVPCRPDQLVVALRRLLVAERFAKASLAVEDRSGLMPRPEITALFDEYAAACDAYRKAKETT